MRNLISLSSLLILTSFHTFAAGPALEVGETTAGGYILDVKSVDQYMQYMDLDAIYVSSAYNGSPGFFVAGEFDRDGSGQKPAQVVGVYFKGDTGLVASSDFNESAPAKDVSSGYSCTKDDFKTTAKIDAKSINGSVFTEQYKGKPKLALMDYLAGYRIIDLQKGEYFGRCKDGQLLKTDSWTYGVRFTLEWKNKADFYAHKKADIANVDIRPGGYGNFAFERSKNGKIKNITALKNLYKQAGHLK